MREPRLARVVTSGILVVATATLFTALGRTARTAVEPRADERVDAARSIAAAVEGTFSAIESQVATIAAALEPWDRGDPDRMETLGRFLAASPALEGGLLVVDATGQVLTTDPARAQLVGRHLAADQLPAEGPGRAGRSGIVIHPLSGLPVIHVASPLRGTEQEVEGTLQGTVPTRLLVDLLSRMGVPDGVELALVAPDGAVLTTDDGSDARMLADVNLTTPARLASNGPGAVRYEGEAGDRRFASYAPVSAGWSVVLSDEADPFAGGLRSPTTLAYLAAGVLLLAVLSVLLMSERRVVNARQQVDRAKRALLAVTGHELRTPLTVVRGMARTLLTHWDRTPDDRRRELLRTIDRQSRSLEHLLERLLFVAELEAGVAGAITARPTDVTEVARSAARTHAALALTHDIEVDVPPTLFAEADPKALDEVLFHLLENAVRYSPGGGEIRVSAVDLGDTIEILVEDEGIGLPADVETIFDRFQQHGRVDTRTVEEGGLGLGLYIVRRLAGSMGGSVSAENRAEGGARFRLVLQSADPPPVLDLAGTEGTEVAIRVP